MRESNAQRPAGTLTLISRLDEYGGPFATPAAAQLLDVRIEAAPGVGTRIMQKVRGGSGEFVLSSVDGRLRARVQLTAVEAATTEHQIGSARVVVDWSRGTIENGDRRTSLSRTELRLLAALFEGNGRTLSRRDLIDRVWPSDRSDDADRENALAVYVCALRKRLAAVGAGRVLHTVRGVGYRVTL